ncbi:hypothetical protein LSAT2_013511 [Lamellibrachia satsuma]|nr:hypothetical protein LSAT2_013511 [Lamellibrachia satsuma]
MQSTPQARHPDSTSPSPRQHKPVTQTAQARHPDSTSLSPRQQKDVVSVPVSSSRSLPFNKPTAMKLMFACVLVFVAADKVSGEKVACYDCTFPGSANCETLNDKTGVSTCNGTSCSSIVTKAKGVTTAVERKCLSTPSSTDACTETTTAAGKVNTCICSTANCNTDTYEDYKEGNKCYDCTYPTDKDCKVPSKTTKTIPCSFACVTITGKSATFRGCLETTKTGCTSDKVDGDTVKTCYCKGNLCNGASFQSVAAVSVFALVVLAAVVAF